VDDGSSKTFFGDSGTEKTGWRVYRNVDCLSLAKGFTVTTIIVLFTVLAHNLGFHCPSTTFQG
jgi:hypothetical protein